MEGLTAQALTALTELTPARLDAAVVGLAGDRGAGRENFVHNTVSDFLHSSQFEDLRMAANRAVHNAVVTGETKRAAVQVDTSSGTIKVMIRPARATAPAAEPAPDAEARSAAT